VPHSRIEPRIRAYARYNRMASTAGEKAMWKYLQSFRPLGARFRRQAPIGNYIADFAWLSARIVIEIDGVSHESEEARLRDEGKENFLRREGFAVFRVGNDAVVANSPSAFSSIEAAILRCLDTPPLTPPHKGEGNRPTLQPRGLR
jgi:very-short-patch-repair endonuclease